MKYLVITIRLPAFDPQVVPAHYEFLDDLRQRSLLEIAGPFTDKSGGAYLLRAGSLEEAQKLADQDPLALRSCSKVTVYEWDAS